MHCRNRQSQPNAGVQVAHQGPAVLGLATVALGEELGTAMAHRALEHLLQYGEPPVRCAVLSLPFNGSHMQHACVALPKQPACGRSATLYTLSTMTLQQVCKA